MAHRHILLPLAALAVAACSDRSLTDSSPIPAAVTVAPDSLVVRLGQTASLSPTVLDGGGRQISGPRLRFSSSRPEVVVVDSLSGVATALATGTARITVMAQPVQVVVPVTVMPVGGGEVASIALGAESLTLETWSLVPQAIGYRAVNTAGESLCGLIPLAVQADTAAFTAHLAAGGDPCLITLTPRAETSGWLRVQAGEKRDSARITVHRTRYRWTFDLPSGTYAAGSIVNPGFAVWGDDGRPVAGIPVHFGVMFDQLDAVTGPDGQVHVPMRLPTSTRVSELIDDSTKIPIKQVFSSSVTRRDLIPDAYAASEIVIIPDAPHHIEFYVHDVHFLERCFYPCRLLGAWADYTRVTADAVAVRVYDKYRDEFGVPGPCFDPVSPCGPPEPLWTDHESHYQTLAAVVADQWGNPTALVPTIVDTGTGAEIVEVRDRFLEVIRVPSLVWDEWLGGRVAFTNLHDGNVTKTVTFTAPGIPSRSIRVTGFIR